MLLRDFKQDETVHIQLWFLEAQQQFTFIAKVQRCNKGLCNMNEREVSLLDKKKFVSNEIECQSYSIV